MKNNPEGIGQGLLDIKNLSEFLKQLYLTFINDKTPTPDELYQLLMNQKDMKNGFKFILDIHEALKMKHDLNKEFTLGITYKGKIFNDKTQEGTPNELNENIRKFFLTINPYIKKGEKTNTFMKFSVNGKTLISIQ